MTETSQAFDLMQKPGVLDFFKRLFVSDFMPHGHCFFWRPDVLWSTVVSDFVIALAYYSIPVALVYFVRKRRDLVFSWIFVMFGIFIVWCGNTHLMDIWTMWHGTYRLSAIVKAITAGISLVTAVVLWPLIPKALNLPSPSQLETANLKLREEMAARERAEAMFRARVDERFRAIVESAPNAIVMTDQKGSINLVNRQAEILFGYRREELLGQKFEKLVPDPSSRGGNLSGVKKDGAKFPVEVSRNRTETADGKFVLAAIIDITERKQTEQILQNAQKELELRVKQRTAELEKAVNDLQKKTDQLQTFHNVTVDREFQMIGLKQEINDLLAKLGQPPKYQKTN